MILPTTSGRNTDGAHPARSGFTLIEVLVASLLSATLLFALWQLMSLNVRLFESGNKETERGQIVRALGQRLTDDLHSAVSPSQKRRAGDVSLRSASNYQPSGRDRSPLSDGDRSPFSDRLLAGDETGSQRVELALPVRAVGFFGTRHALQLDVLRAVDDARDGFTDPFTQAPRAGELRSVVYQFLAPGQSVDRITDRASAQAHDRITPGLTRREVPWTPHRAGETGLAQRRNLAPSASAPDSTLAEDSDFSQSRPDARTASVDDDSLMQVPEVTWLEFRYFDGRRWSTQWDSRQKKSLPLAVAVAMHVGLEDSRLPEKPARNVIPVDTENGRSLGPTESRLLIRLPAAAQPSISLSLDAAGGNEQRQSQSSGGSR